MKTTIRSAGFVILGIGLLFGGCARKKSTSWESIKNPEAVAQLKSFVAEKEAQANAAAGAGGQTVPPEVQQFFRAAERGDWLAVSNQLNNFMRDAAQNSGKTNSRFRGMPWEPMVREIWGGLDAFGEGDAKYSALYANDIIESIPAGGIYFGGTDPGRFLITAMQKNQAAGDPFFTLTQNALADGTYLDYLRLMYGDKLYIPTADDAAKCFQNYTEDVTRRQLSHQLKPGENVQVGQNGRVQVSGQVAVMEINGLLARIFFDRNTNQEFYIEESFPLDWMYPYLEPHGIIFKLNRQPLTQLSDEIIQRDHDYWVKAIRPMIGAWLNDDTPVQGIVDFSKKVFLRHDFSGFTGDRRFVENDYSSRMFSFERSNIADFYIWRMNHAATPDGKARMAHEADFAFRQALALCPYNPYNPQTADSYASFLHGQHRDSDARLVNEMARQFRSRK